MKTPADTVTEMLELLNRSIALVRQRREKTRELLQRLDAA